MIQVPMTPQEFENIESILEHADPAQKLELRRITATSGNLKGHSPVRWSADFTFDGQQLCILGHSMFGDARVEHGLQERLAAALAALRAPHAG